MVVWKVSRLHPVTRFKLWELEQLNRDKLRGLRQI